MQLNCPRGLLHLPYSPGPRPGALVHIAVKLEGGKVGPDGSREALSNHSPIVI